jgi:hypothetical protein
MPALPLSVNYILIRPNNEDIFKRPRDSKWLKGTMTRSFNLPLRPNHVQIITFSRQIHIKLLKNRSQNLHQLEKKWTTQW